MLKEEIKRIKELFGDERLYGNLITETNPDTNADGKIDKDEFGVSGEEIDADEAALFLQPLSTYSVAKKGQTNKGCGDPGSNIAKVKQLLDNAEEKYVIDKHQGFCYIEWTRPIAGGKAEERFLFYEKDKVFKRAIEMKNTNDYILDMYQKRYGLKGGEVDINRIFAIGTYNTNSDNIPFKFKVTKKRKTDGKTVPVLQISTSKNGELIKLAKPK